MAFVCKGNINRSAFAQTYAKSKFPVHSEIYSSGYFPKEGRKSPYRAVIAAKNRSVDLLQHRSSIISRELMEKAGVVFVFDLENRDMLKKRYPAMKKKIIVLGVFSGEKSAIIPDPDKKSAQTYAACFSKITESIDALYSSMH